MLRHVRKHPWIPASGTSQQHANHALQISGTSSSSFPISIPSLRKKNLASHLFCQLQESGRICCETKGANYSLLAWTLPIVWGREAKHGLAPGPPPETHSCVCWNNIFVLCLRGAREKKIFDRIVLHPELHLRKYTDCRNFLLPLFYLDDILSDWRRVKPKGYRWTQVLFIFDLWVWVDLSWFLKDFIFTLI